MKNLFGLLTVSIIALSSFTSKKEEVVVVSKKADQETITYYWHCTRNPKLTGSVTCKCSRADAQSIANMMCSI